MDENIKNSNFIWDFIEEDIAAGKAKNIQTRFPPEPNGYLHIGHTKALFIDFSTAERFGGKCNLRFDDTNPTKEDEEFVDAIKEDIAWMGFKWDNVFYGSDYFDTCYEIALKFIREGKAYVCDLDKDQMREYRGTLTEPGKNSPWRDRSVEENLDLFERMKNGEFPDGSRTLRAKIDMASPNMNMRDPAMYRIIHMKHHHLGDKWCIYPMYDFAHPIQDAIEGVTHSLCSLEYEDHRPLYDWVVKNAGFENPPRQIEFSRLNITHTVMSKRYLRRLVEEKYVDGWDDPRMPTLCGLRRRGYTPSSIRKFLVSVGISKTLSIVDWTYLEHCIREELNETAERTMAVLHPVKLIIDNYPDGQVEKFEADCDVAGEKKREISFSKELWIEAEDFMEEPVKGYFRLFPGNEVRLKHAYYVTCKGCDKDENGNIVAVHADYDPESRGGGTLDGRKVKGTIHWVDASTAVDAEVRLYDNLFSAENPGTAEDFITELSDTSLEIITNAKLEPEMANATGAYQFLRTGYFVPDSKYSKPGHPVFNRTVSLKDSFNKKK